MSRISFRDNGEEHNFWQNYTDLMAGLLIVFIIASLVTIGKPNGGSAGKEEGESQVDTFAVGKDIYDMIKEFEEAKDSIGNSNLIKYNEKYKRFEYSKEVLFEPGNAEIPKEYLPDLTAAGREIEKLIEVFDSAEYVSFKIVIEGRAALSADSVKNNPNYPSPAQKTFADSLSYYRAHNLYLLWEKNKILNDIDEKSKGEIFVCGSGFGGKNRYKKGEEGKNKTFIIHIIPYINLP